MEFRGTFWFAKDNRLVQVYDMESRVEIWRDVHWCKRYPPTGYWGLAIIRGMDDE